MPARHTVQLWTEDNAPVRPAVPGGHDRQALTLGASTASLHFPRWHSLHSSRRFNPTALDQRPAGQEEHFRTPPGVLSSV